MQDAVEQRLGLRVEVVVRLGAGASRWGYALIAGSAYVWPIAMVFAGRLPPIALLSILAAAASFAALRILWTEAAHPQALAPALKLTIVAALAHGLTMAATIAFKL